MGSSVPRCPMERSPRYPARAADDIVRGEPGRLVDDEDTIHERIK